MENLIILLTILLTVTAARVISVVVHEFGHGVVALLLTRQKVEIYIGSHGDKLKSIKMNLGRLIVYMKPFAWKGGLCDHGDSNPSKFQNALIILAGPLTNLLLGLFFLWLLIYYNENSFLSFLNLMLFILFTLDFLVNIIPRGREIILSDGRITYNDGELLKRILKSGIQPKGFQNGVTLYNNKDYAKASEIFERLISEGHKNEMIYRYAFSAFIMNKNYKAANELLPEYLQYVKPSADEYCNIGLVKQNTGDYDAGILNYNRSLEMAPKNPVTFNNRGYAYNSKREFEKAIHNFDMAIRLSPDWAFPYNNRGYAYIKTGRLEEGLKDIKQSLKMDDKNSYAYRNLGIYYWEVKDYEKAALNFTRANEIDKDTPETDDYLNRLKQLMGKS